MAFTVDSTTIWDKLKSSTSNQDKAPKYKPTKDPLSDPKKGLKSKLAVNSTDKTPSQKEGCLLCRERRRKLSTLLNLKKKEHIPISETKKSGTLQSGYTPLSSRPLFKSTHHSMKNLSLNSQNDATNESLSSSTDSYRPNAP
ncbi:unnamed protein product [Hanseniaspora opuntiae]